MSRRFSRRLGAGLPPFSPLSIPGIALWLRADLGVTTGATFTWADQSGNGNNYTQATAGDQPAQTAGAGPLGGSQPGIVFTSASNNFLSNASSAIIGANNWTVFVVWKTTTTASVQYGFSSGTTGGGGWGIGVGGSASNRTMTAFGAVVESFGAATTSYEKWSLQNSANVQSARVNGSSVAVSPGGVIALAPNAASTVGSFTTTPSDPWSGTMWEIIAYNAVLSAGQIAQIEAYQNALTGL